PYLINWQSGNETTRGNAKYLIIENAIQKTALTTAAVSAEYGRFQGEVVSALTKSGGNAFSGYARMTIDNNKWTALTPFPNDSRLDKIVPTYEFTLGGPIKKDKLWFFGAGRLRDFQQQFTTGFTNINFIDDRNQKRYEGKLTF